jgi:ribosomal protein S18 acetylase RimI-like enzyme
MLIRHLTPGDAPSFQVLRLAALREAPTAFGSSYEEEKDHPLSTFEEWLAVKSDRGPLGAFEDGTLVGIACLGRESLKKRSHKAFIWGMYVVPHARRKGVGRTLLLEALTFARSIPEVQQVNLCVNASNTSAIHLYHSCGFREFGRESGAMLINGELHDELHMCLVLH